MKQIVVPVVISSGFIIATFLTLGFLEESFLERLQSITDYHYSYSALSFLVLASDAVLPVPSSILLYTNGFVLGIANALVVSMGGLMLGAVIGYYIGRIANMKNKSSVQAEKLIGKFGPSVILITRGIPILSESICFVSGYNNIPFGKYLTLNFMGYLPVVLLYTICGQLGYQRDIFLITFGSSLLIAAAFWIVGKHYLDTTAD